jgi:small subunit ribosomal protein S6
LLRKYEGMFLFDPVVVSDWEGIQAELNRLLERADARMIASTKWDERRLAYEVRGRKRGIYALTYFEAEPARIADIERDVQLSESALRCLILRVDHLTEDEMKEAASKPVSQAPPEDERAERSHEGRRGRKPEAPAAEAKSEKESEEKAEEKAEEKPETPAQVEE